MAKKKLKVGYSRHHINPKSRSNDSSAKNIAIVQKDLHQKYHALLSNLTPDEIIKYLVEEWWNGQWHWVQKALSDRRLK